ncbi:Stress-antifung domain-containing protein [Cephalotus follicularis]|uniref:Stress-antifung domain-containing protein n=1 Tax=Cephalotus follicularis TaxID=3775 RepID=A0A1Q3C0Z8_CEPFO|nr:Stress-antifung domain-containing protein [Cephalotus follicularis]
MVSSRLTYSLYLLSFAVLLQTVFGDDPLFHYCSSNENFTADSPYETNLNKLMGYLYYNTPVSGFGLSSLGQSPNQANGLALCRGDVSSADCKACVVNASSEILKLCPQNEAAIVFFDKCLLKYSNESFFGQIDNSVKFYMWNTQNVSDIVAFNRQTRELLSLLAKEASATQKMYAAGELDTGGAEKIYGMTQCTRDLSSTDCKKCLDGMIDDDLPSCCDGKQGGRVVGGSCNIRYETYPFINNA